MTIKNNSDSDVSWFVFNQADLVKVVALASGDLKKGGSTTYDPPQNNDGLYFVRFTPPGGGHELAGGSVRKDGCIALVGSEGKYNTQPC